jgi:membrane-associated phospholipid phosphatase
MKKFLLIFILSFNIIYAQKNKEVIQHIGDVTQFITPATALLLTLTNKDKKGTLKFAESFATTSAIVFILKESIKKQRPDKRGYNSFPSGHTAASFQGAAFIQRRYGWKFGIPAYILASYTGFSRVYSKRHYVEDVLAGAAIGIGSVYLFTKPFKQPKIDITYSRTNDNGYLIGLNYKF